MRSVVDRADVTTEEALKGEAKRGGNADGNSSNYYFRMELLPRSNLEMLMEGQKASKKPSIILWLYK